MGSKENTQRDLLSDGSFPTWPQWPELGQRKVLSQESGALSHGCRDQALKPSCTAFQAPLAGTWVETIAAKTQAGACTGNWRPGHLFTCCAIVRAPQDIVACRSINYSCLSSCPAGRITLCAPCPWLQDSILEELDKEDSTHGSGSQESESEEDGIRVDSQKALALKDKVLQWVRLHSQDREEGGRWDMR